MHLDLDAFFVEVCRRHLPELRDVDLLIVGGRRQSRGVVQSASYGARAFGVRSGMPVAEAARRCPKATFVKGEFNWYRDASRTVGKVLEGHAPRVVMVGLDEGYLDYTGTDLLHPVSLMDAAVKLRTAVSVATGLDCSIGIGANRMIAKIASGYAKPRAICEVRPGWERGFLAGLPLRAIPGIGPKTGERLAQYGLVDVAQIQQMPQPELAQLLGDDDAASLKRRTDGHGSSVVQARSRPKSVSRETTFSHDVGDRDELDRVLLLLTSRVAAQLRDEDLVASTVVLKLRHSDFRTVTRQRPLQQATALDKPIREAARSLLAPALADATARGQRIRLIGVAAVNLQPEPLGDLFGPIESGAATEIARAIDTARHRFGTGAIQPGRLLRRPDPTKSD